MTQMELPFSKHISEARFKEHVLEDLKLMPYVWFIKTMERARRGTPDIIMCIRGMFVGIELKREGEEATPLQALTLKKITDAKGYAFTATPSSWPMQREVLYRLGVKT